MAGVNGLYLAGHSLGGALAIIAAARYKLPSVTFNAPGVMDSCVLSSTLKEGTLRYL
jgi:putative lipase involved disintegration of autophagic bodies